MNCPICNDVHLIMSDRQGIEIDYCPKCRGVWLDRGELDKIIERSAPGLPPQGIAPAASPAYPAQQQQQYDQRYSHPQQHGHAHPQQGGYPKKKKREGFLGELFDFD
ncbi:zf-TFIIB domain-containing protein [Noviherbaspirillum sedimenti]|uniref:Transcription factor zinc-finger domain-containing protein n=1 Tax=Noviherbaspirillum sedimenti TaxID=2320865 RepID=A0A3A3G9L7_9BURK|nr:zf-TFIIB domain-containing protein [Noviherbaspirillum sedimenti]RJG03439.1 hypothetical protein D3878_19085 [Noviherbaspirillum sedimenti]